MNEYLRYIGGLFYWTQQSAAYLPPQCATRLLPSSWSRLVSRTAAAWIILCFFYRGMRSHRQIHTNRFWLRFLVGMHAISFSFPLIGRLSPTSASPSPRRKKQIVANSALRKGGPFFKELSLEIGWETLKLAPKPGVPQSDPKGKHAEISGGSFSSADSSFVCDCRGMLCTSHRRPRCTYRS